MEGLVVEQPFAGDDQVGTFDARGQLDRSATSSKPLVERGAERRQPPGQAAGRARAVEGADVDAKALLVELGQALSRRVSRSTWAGDAPFCGEKVTAASTKRVVTSQPTCRSTPASRLCGSRTSSAPHPPSVVAEPPTPTSTCRAPALTAAAISSPVPAVLARIGSLPSGPPTRSSPDASAISIEAVTPSSRRYQGASMRLAERPMDPMQMGPAPRALRQSLPRRRKPAPGRRSSPPPWRRAPMRWRLRSRSRCLAICRGRLPGAASPQCCPRRLTWAGGWKGGGPRSGYCRGPI